MTEAEEKEVERNRLRSDIIDTMLAGMNIHRPDLTYPASHSDMNVCVSALLRMYEVKRRPLIADKVLLSFPIQKSLEEDV